MRKKLATLLLILMTNVPVAYAMTPQDYIELRDCVYYNQANDLLLDKFLTDLSEKKPEALEFLKTNDIAILIAMHDDCFRFLQKFQTITEDIGIQAPHGPAAAHYDDVTDPAPGTYGYDEPEEDPRMAYLLHIKNKLIETHGNAPNWYIFYNTLYNNHNFRNYPYPHRISDAFALGVSYNHEKKCLSPAMSKDALDVLVSVDFFYRLPEYSRGSTIQLLNATAIDAVHILKTSLETTDFYYEPKIEITKKITNILFTGDKWGIDYTRTATPEEFQIILSALTQATQNFDSLEDIDFYYSYGLDNRYTHSAFDHQIQEHCHNMFLCAAMKWLASHSNPDNVLENFDTITTKIGKDYKTTFDQIDRIESAFSSPNWILEQGAKDALNSMIKIREETLEGIAG